MAPIDRIFIISLERRRDRFQRIYKELYARRLEHLVVPVLATDGRDLPPSVANKPTGWHFSVGERGCFDSHRKVWQMVVNMGCDNALILEDDMKCTNLDSALGVIEPYNHDSLNIGVYETYNMERTSDGTFVADLTKESSGAVGAGAYTVTPKAAQAFLDGCKDMFPMHVDHYISTHPVIQQHVFLPSLLDIYWDNTSDTNPETHAVSANKCNWIPLAFITLLAALAIYFFTRK